MGIFFVLLLALVALLADDLNRSVIGYVLLSCIVSPIIVLILLACLGQNDNY